MRFFTLFTGLFIASLGLRADAGDQTPIAKERNQTLISERHTNAFKARPLAPGPDDSRIARVAAAILERNHYLQQPFDDAVSSKFLDKYLDALDPAHLVFFQTDLAQFEKWRTKLDDMTLGAAADTSPADIIFNRFLEHFAQQVEYATNLIATEKFEFKGNDRYMPNRKELPRPRDLTDARQLWRERVRVEWLNELLDKKKAPEIQETLTRRYTRQLRMLQEFDSDDVFQIYLDSLAHVYDPHSDYMGKPTLDNFNIQMKLSLFGIGALLRSEDGYCKIQELMDGPAKKSGQIKPNDKIIAVAQGSNEPVDVVDMKLNKVVELIRGPKGTEVRLTVVPVDAPDPSTRKVITLIRDEIKLEDQEAKAKLLELPGEDSRTPFRVGIIDLPSFYADLKNRSADRKSTTSDVAKLLQKLKAEKAQGIILDLRRNGGGSLEAHRFVHQGRPGRAGQRPEWRHHRGQGHGQGRAL
jgi:carboxyl-terminal processing protease